MIHVKTSPFQKKASASKKKKRFPKKKKKEGHPEKSRRVKLTERRQTRDTDRGGEKKYRDAVQCQAM